MIKLYQFKPAFGLPNASPFCMKVETYLRMAGLPYECPRGASVSKAPKGKMPYIEDGDKRVADSSFIVDYLKQTYGDRLDAYLSGCERAIALSVQRLIEEHLYWAAVYSRWVDEAGFTVSGQIFFSHMPPLLKQVVPLFARRAMKKQLYGHGMGRHSPEEIYALGCRDIVALSEFLGDKPYFMGAEASSLDAIAYAFVANLLWVPIASPLRAHAQKLPNLEAYCQRMKARYYAA